LGLEHAGVVVRGEALEIMRQYGGRLFYSLKESRN